MFQIGNFSIISRLSVKTLRFYHKEGILVPDYIDDESGYRYYRESSLETAFVIKSLRDMEFTVKEIKEMLANFNEDTEILSYLETQKNKMHDKAQHYSEISNSIDRLINTVRSNEMKNKNVDAQIIEKDLVDIIFASIRFKGKYNEVGKVFGKIGKAAGRQIAGAPFSLYYDGEYKEEADIEAGFPVSRILEKKDILCSVIKGTRAVTIIHKGSYETIGESYKTIFSYLEERKIKPKLPTREVYIKGPGMIFKGNPDKYITEIQIPIE